MRRLLPVFLLCLAVLAGATHAQAEKRVALVIGNAAYPASPLRNPLNDARAIAAKLEQLGFAVILRENLTQRQIGATLREFRSRLAPGAEAVFFYAGHGIQARGVNYLPAVDADIAAEEDVPTQSIDANKVLEIMEEARTRLNLVFLDACRNNPFTRRFRSAGGGLAKMVPASGTILSFATRPGSVADDGAGEHGLYTEHLLQAMDRQGLPIEQALKQVHAGVKRASRGRQEPWSEGGIEGDFFFVPGPAAPVPDPLAQEREAWQAAQEINSAAGYLAYLEGYPRGQFAPAARIRLAALREAAAAPQSAAPSAGRRFRDCGACPEMVVLPAGEFDMGSPAAEASRLPSEDPRHRVRVAPFALARTEVTRGQFAAFAAATGHRPSGTCFVLGNSAIEARPGVDWRRPGYSQADDHPAVCLSWHDAKAYVAWLARTTGRPYRLPSEAEWEYAARAGTDTARYWGDGAADACRYANVMDDTGKRTITAATWQGHGCDDGHAYTAPVARYRANAFGLHDMIGNVWEWVEDCWHESYEGAPADGSARTTGSCEYRVLRGGAWDSRPANARSADRYRNPPERGDDIVGLRPALSLP